jgi:hypothetical protein
MLRKNEMSEAGNISAQSREVKMKLNKFWYCGERYRKGMNVY